MKKFISVLLCVILAFSSFAFAVSAQGEEPTALSFNSNGKFTVLQITDPQDDQFAAYELRGFIEKAIEAAKPDFIVLTGDIVEDSRAGDFGTDGENLREGVLVSGDYEKTLQNVKATVAEVFAPLEASGIPYAVTQGNNDYKSTVTNEDWLKIYAEYPGCITDDYCDMLSGKLDYFVPVLSFGSDEAAFGLWLLDNGSGFDENQLKWLESYQSGNVASVAFEHIPLEDIGNLFEECKPWDEGAIISGGKTYRLNGEFAGGHAEGVVLPGSTSEQFTVLKEKNVLGAFFGHWHTSGYTGTWDGIILGPTYGCQFAKASPYGIRTVVLDEKTGTIETELYEYTGGEFVLQVDEPYAEYENTVDKILAAIKNLFECVLNAIKYSLKF